jgi:hypothetical protein
MRWFVVRPAAPGTGCDRTAAGERNAVRVDVTVPVSGSYSLEDGTGRPEVRDGESCLSIPSIVVVSGRVNYDGIRH